MTTPEWQPPAPAEFAGIVSRAAALLVDVGVLLVTWAVLRALPVSGGLGNAVLLVGVAASMLYFPLAWRRYGTTLGMRLLGLRIVRSDDGAKIDARVAILRFIVFLPTLALTVVLVGLVLAVPVVLDRRRRAVHDRVAGTVVIRLPYRGTSDPISPWFQ